MTIIHLKKSNDNMPLRRFVALDQTGAPTGRSGILEFPVARGVYNPGPGRAQPRSLRAFLGRLRDRAGSATLASSLAMHLGLFLVGCALIHLYATWPRDRVAPETQQHHAGIFDGVED